MFALDGISWPLLSPQAALRWQAMAKIWYKGEDSACHISLELSILFHKMHCSNLLSMKQKQPHNEPKPTLLSHASNPKYHWLCCQMAVLHRNMMLVFTASWAGKASPPKGATHTQIFVCAWACSYKLASGCVLRPKQRETHQFQRNCCCEYSEQMSFCLK